MEKHTYIITVCSLVIVSVFMAIITLNVVLNRDDALKYRVIQAERRVAVLSDELVEVRQKILILEKNKTSAK